MKLFNVRGLLMWVGVLALASPAAYANLVQNGDFQSTPGLTASGQIDAPLNDVADWSSSVKSSFGNNTYNFIYFPGQATTAGPGAADLTDGGNPHVWLYGQNDNPLYDLTSPAGGNFLAADADPLYSSAITQTVNNLVVGATYDLSFYWGGAQYTTEVGPTTEQWVVGLGSETQSTAVIDNASQSFTGWQQANLFFTATSTSETLSFLANGTPSNAPPVAVLDGVSLTQTPEPGYYALMVIGLGLLFFTARRRSKSANQSV